jgi:hypothetical protein
MKKNTSAPIFARTTSGSTHVGGSMPKGSIQPPRKIVTVSRQTVSMFRYSAKRKATIFVPPYSVM